MVKLDRPKGLVRYDSMNGLAGEKRRIIRPRVFLYAFLGLLGLGALTVAAVNKAKPYNFTSSRMIGPPFLVDGSSIRNNYQILLANKRNQPASFVVTLSEAPEGYELSGAGQTIDLPARGDLTRPAILMVPHEFYKGPCDITIKVVGQPGDVEISHTVRFVGPNPSSLKKTKQ